MDASLFLEGGKELFFLAFRSNFSVCHPIGNTCKKTTSVSIGALKCNFAVFQEIMTDRPTDQPTNRRTLGLIGKLQFSKISQAQYTNYQGRATPGLLSIKNG